VRDYGAFKALGMSPRQTVAMVVTSVAVIGLTAGLVGTPIGVLLHDAVLPSMGSAAGTTVPAADIAVYHPLVVLPLLLGGVLIAVAGALLPAWGVARRPAVVALRTE
jgi:putative ABC transport system permease protein